MVSSLKRDIFAEIREGFAALADERAGKITLTRHGVDRKPSLAVTAEEILALRERLTLSRAVFARAQRVNIPTPENGEQGRARPTAQAVLLTRMVESYADTLERLAGFSRERRGARMPGLCDLERRAMMKHQQIRLGCHEEGVGLSPDIREFHQIDTQGRGIHDSADLPASQAFLGTILDQSDDIKRFHIHLAMPACARNN